LDNIGHMTYPGNASFDAAKQRWFVPICCRTDRGSIAVGDAEVDPAAHILYVPSREEMRARLSVIAGHVAHQKTTPLYANGVAQQSPGSRQRTLGEQNSPGSSTPKGLHKANDALCTTLSG
jgi:hypothetical protein